VRLRDFVDVVNGLEHVKLYGDPEVVKAGFTEDMAKVPTKNKLSLSPGASFFKERLGANFFCRRKLSWAPPVG
jgi:hypothetical protein